MKTHFPHDSEPGCQRAKPGLSPESFVVPKCVEAEGEVAGFFVDLAAYEKEGECMCLFTRMTRAVVFDTGAVYVVVGMNGADVRDAGSGDLVVF